MGKNLSVGFFLKGLKAVVLTISDSCSQGKREDQSGAMLCDFLRKHGAEILKQDIIGDDKSLIIKKLKFFCDRLKASLVLSIGGTGLSPRDVTPEATMAVIEKEIRGLEELMRGEGAQLTKRAALSRAVIGIRKKTLIVNLPGSPRGALESFSAIAELIPHALAMMRGEGH